VLNETFVLNVQHRRDFIEHTVDGSSSSEDETYVEAVIQKKTFHWLCWWQKNAGNDFSFIVFWHTNYSIIMEV
jgi:hypothetical protein